jgi:hypothetical protein
MELKQKLQMPILFMRINVHRAIDLQEFRQGGLEGRLDFYWSLYVTRFMGAVLRPTLASWAWP